jgi:ABC-2 type transport system ATP-binding protein
LPEVTGVTRRGDEVAVAGRGDLVGAVASTLAAKGVVAQQLQVDQPNLEDVFVALTKRAPSPIHKEAQPS